MERKVITIRLDNNANLVDYLVSKGLNKYAAELINDFSILVGAGMKLGISSFVSFKLGTLHYTSLVEFFKDVKCFTDVTPGSLKYLDDFFFLRGFGSFYNSRFIPTLKELRKSFVCIVEIGVSDRFKKKHADDFIFYEWDYSFTFESTKDFGSLLAKVGILSSDFNFSFRVPLDNENGKKSLKDMCYELAKVSLVDVGYEIFSFDAKGFYSRISRL